MDDIDTQLERERQDSDDDQAITRALPESQQPDGELDGTEMVAYREAAELAAHFEGIETATIGDGLVHAPVTAIEASPGNSAVAVEVDVPAEEDDEQFFMDKPKTWTNDYAFVRWVEGHGYTAGDFQGMIEKNVKVEVRREDGEYELVVPEKPTPPVRSTAARAGLSVLESMAAAKSGAAALALTLFLVLSTAFNVMVLDAASLLARVMYMFSGVVLPAVMAMWLYFALAHEP